MALQMTWNPSLLHQKRKNGPPLGLKNIGNTCYLNSVLQCLTYTPPLANFCLKNQHSSLCDSSSEATERKRDCPFCILEKRIVRSLSVDLTLDAPSKIQSCLRIFSEHFRLGRQEDAHEFLRYVIDACHNSCLRLKKQRRKGTEPNVTAGGDSVVKEIFGGALQSQVKCLSCGAESNKVDEIMDISLDLFQSNSLKEALQRFFRPEVLDGSNKYKCEKCKKLVAAKKQMSIQQAPNILVIQLKRFEGVLGGKIDRAIAFEEVLVLSSYMCKASQDPHPEYKLFGTIVHSGYSSDSGHYYAYIKDAMGRWYCCNDSYVSVSTLQEVLSERVYILFFSRTSQRPKISKTAFVSNGAKTPEQNGNDSSVSQKAEFSMKTGSASLHGEHSSRKDISTMSKTGTVPSSSRMKFGNLRNPDSKRVLANGNGNLDVHKMTLMENHRDLKVPLHVEKVKKEMPSIINRNGGKENKSAIAANCKNKPTFGESCENGEENVGTSSVKAEVCEGDGTRANEKVTAGRGPSIDRSLLNGEGKCQSDTPGLKRKSNGKESCILFAQDDFSRLKLEEFKESLRKDASSMLQSCGWSDKVYNFMCTRKRLCAREAGNSPTTNIDPKKLLVAEAKSTFISQIPESLKEKLVEQLRSFSKERQISEP